MRKILLFLPLLLSTTLISCMKDEEYTVNPADCLTFSTDTVAFDTIISGSPTNTYTFSVHNPSKKAIRIPQVVLELGANSPFRVNVDGTPLQEGVAHDFEIAAKDSLIVYLMANVPEIDNDLPIDVSDKLTFTTEAGVSQSVVLTASGQAVIPLQGKRITEDITLDAKRPYRIMDSLVVEAGHTLTLAAGTNFLFHAKAQLIVYGTLKVTGTAQQPVTLRGDRLGNMFDGQPYDRIPGQWGGIVLKSSSYDNHINFADIHSGTFGIQADSADVKRTKLTLENSIVHNTSGNGLDLRMVNAYVGNSQLTNAGGNCVQVRGGDVRLIHCTLARFYVFKGGNGVALDFANHDNGIRLPLERLLVANSVVTGYQDDEIMGNQNMEQKNDAFAYRFRNCLLNTPKPKEETSQMENCQWDWDDDTTAEGDTLVTKDKNFQPEPNLDKLLFSFELSPHSKAIGHADPAITAETYPVDRKGTPRGSTPDIGCYQYVKPASKP